MTDDLDLSEFLPSPSCKVAKALESLTEHDRRLFTAALAHPDVVMRKLIVGFRARGIGIGHESIARHRSGECPCD